MSKKSQKKEQSETPSAEADVELPASEQTSPEEENESVEAAPGEEYADIASPESEVTESRIPEAVTEDAIGGVVPLGEVPTLPHVLEAILFASQKAVTPKELVAHLKSAGTTEPNSVAAAFLRVKEADIREGLEQLRAEVAASERAYQVRETATGWLLCSAPGFAPWLRALYPEAKPTRLSAPALETLAIIAYRQPIARADIEAVRGVAVDGVMQTILDRGLVKISGRAEVAGRPLLYATTQYFLDHFGLRHLDELPNAAELRHIPLPKATPEPEAPGTDEGGTPELPGVSEAPVENDAAGNEDTEQADTPQEDAGPASVSDEESEPSAAS